MEAETAGVDSLAVHNVPSDVSKLRAEPLGIAFKTGYGIGQCVESLATALLNVFLFFYLTTVCGMAGSLAGLALFLALAIDSVADPLVGSISDNLRTRWGRRVPPMAFSLLPIGIALGLLFEIPPALSEWALFGYVFLLLTSLRVALSAFIIPYFGLGAEISDDYDERSRIVGFRAIFGMIATLAGYVLGFQVFLGGTKGLLDRAAYVPFGWTSAAIMVAAGTFAVFVSLQALPRLHATRPSRGAILPRLAAEVREVFRNSSFRTLFGGVLVFFVGQGVFVTLGLHASRYFWNFSTAVIQATAIGSVIGLALGLPVAFILIGRVEKLTVVLWGVAAICATEAAPVLLQLGGLLPRKPDVLAAILVAASALIGALTTLVAIAFQSSMADAVDQHESLFGTRREGLYFASLSFASKAATGLGSLISGLLLDLIRFPGARIAAGKHVIIPYPVSRDLGLAYGPMAATITIVSVWIFSHYRLGRRAHAAIRATLGRQTTQGV